MLMLIGEHPTDQELDEMLRMVDCGGDGQVSFQDFFRGLFQEKGPVPAEMAGIVQMLREANAPAQEDIDAELEEREKAGKPVLDGPSVRDIDMMLVGASGFMYNLQ